MGRVFLVSFLNIEIKYLLAENFVEILLSGEESNGFIYHHH